MTKKTLRKFHDQLVKGNLDMPKEEMETIERDDWIYIYGKDTGNLYLAIDKESAGMLFGDL